MRNEIIKIRVKKSMKWKQKSISEISIKPKAGSLKNR